ncbi:MAG: polysaccharide biosynthesis tyrosine autokinase [Bacteroidaceae bacterium]|nr:polysaccharide biosynthesis tyrosine autokinase [Bacteroidaceae bacterium]
MEENKFNPNNVVIMQQAPQNQQEEEDEGLDIINILMRCLSNWYWFVICAAIAFALAFFNVKSQENVYSRSATIMIKEESSSSNSLSNNNLGLFKSTSTVSNEIIAMKTPQVVNDVVKRLKLNMNYSKDGRFHRQTLYGWNLPIEVIMEDVPDEGLASLTVSLKKDGSLTLKDFSKGGNKTVKGKLNEHLDTPIGKVLVILTDNHKASDVEIQVVHNMLSSTAALYSKKLAIAQREESASVIDLSCSDVSIERAEDFLNMVITVYSEYWVNDKNQIATSTNEFISERLAVIEKELGSVDSDISSYKSQNLIPNLSGSIGQNMSLAAAANQKSIELNNQLSMVRFLKDYLQTNDDPNRLIPAVSDIGSSSIENQIRSYNDMVLERKTLVSNSSEENPLVKERDAQLAEMRAVLMSSIDNQIVAFNTQLRTTQSTESKATSKMATNPEQEKYLLSVERQQAVKQALYTYLLQKREENELSRAFTAYNTRLLNPPTGSNTAIAPNSKQIYTIYLVIGLLIPLVVIILLELLNTTVRGRKDLEHMQTPFLGEIPFVQQEKRGFLRRLISSGGLGNFFKNDPVMSKALMRLGFWKKSDRQSDKNLKLYVKEGSRNQINEAFRVVRSNMEFMQGENEHQIVMITSANAGSGKTFVTLNLAASFAIKDRKVLAIDLDFRKRSLSKYVNKPHHGLADYLAKRAENYDNLIIKSSLVNGLDILPVGSIPPNPTELLYSERLGVMLEELKKEYDLIFLDCPPVEIVADASIVAKYADKTIFMIRAGLLQRNMLPEIDKFYDNKKFGNMALLLNGTDDSYGKYGYSKYGYRYGYHYGYGSHYTSES